MLLQRGTAKVDQTHETMRVEHMGAFLLRRLPRGWGVSRAHGAPA